jgi:hypothetical protein
MTEQSRESKRRHKRRDDSSALLLAAMSAKTSAEPPDLVKYTSGLADALGVSRQAVHVWRFRPDAPQRTGGRVEGRGSREKSGR